MQLSIKTLLNTKRFSTLLVVVGTAISIAIPFGVPLTIFICCLIYLYTTDSDRYNKIIKKFPSKLGEIIELIMKGEGDIKHKIKEILRALKKDKELQNSLEKFTSADYKNREEFEKEIQELFGTETKEEALKLYLQLKDFYQANLKVLFSDIKDKKEEILKEFKERFENLNQNLEKFNEEILKEFRETELYKEGFEIITAYDISTVEPNKNCWNEGFVLNDVLHDLDARRKITNDVEKALENKDVIVRGESGFGKSTFFYRIIADFIDKGYTIIYKENGGDLKHPNSDARIIAKYAKDWKVLVAIDNVHYYRNINAFDIVKDLSGQNNIRFFFTAREPEFRDFLREDKEFWKEKPELKKKVRTAMDKMENFEIEKLTEKEAEIFVKKYYEVVGKEITDEVIREKSQSYYEWSNEGDPLLFTFFLTGNGLKENVEYKYTNFIDNKIKEDIALFSCILESVGIEIKAEYIKTCLDLGDREYENAIRELVGKILYTEDKKKFRTRHPRWAIEYLKFRYEKEDELFRDELIEKLEDLTSALFDLNKEELAYNFISGLSGLLVYNKDLREFLAPSLKVPEFLSKDKKAELYAVDVGRFYYEIGDYNKAIECTDKAIELNPEYAEAYIVHGIAYYSKGELDLAINDFNVAIKLNPDLAEAYINRGIAYAEKGELDLAINDFNVAIKLNPDLAEAYGNRGIAYYNISDFFNCANDFGKAAMSFFLQKRFDNAMDAFKKAYDLRTKTNNPICYECGIAFAAYSELEILYFDCTEILIEVQKHKDKLSESASLVLDYLITGKTEKELVVKDEMDEVFKRLLEGLKK